MKITLRAARINRGYSVPNAAKEAGISVDSLYSYEAGKVVPKVDTLCRLCEVYGCKLDDLALDIFLPRDYGVSRNDEKNYDEIRNMVEQERGGTR